MCFFGGEGFKNIKGREITSTPIFKIPHCHVTVYIHYSDIKIKILRNHTPNYTHCYMVSWYWELTTVPNCQSPIYKTVQLSRAKGTDKEKAECLNDQIESEGTISQWRKELNNSMTTERTNIRIQESDIQKVAIVT